MKSETRLSGRSIYLYLTTILAVKLCIFFITSPRPYIASAIGMHDVWMSYGPAMFLMDYGIHHGDFPFWNPLIFCGMPFAASPAYAVFYPPNVVRSLLNFDPTALKSYLSVSLLVWIHMLFCATGLYLLMRRHGLRFIHALAVGLFFVLSASFVRHSMEHWVIIAGVSWLPWLLLLEDKALSSTSLRETMRLSLLMGVLFGTSMLQGYIQVCCYIAVAMVTYATAYRLTDSGSTRRISLWLKDWLMLATTHVVAVLIAAVMLLPAAEFSQLTSRIKGSGFGAPYGLEVPSVGALFEYLVVYPGAPRWILDFRAAGSIVFLLAVGAVLSRRKTMALRYALLSLVLLDIAIGPPMPFSEVLAFLVPFQMSHAGSALMFCFALSIVAGLGLEALTDSARRLPLRLYSGLLLVLGAVIAGYEIVNAVIRPSLLPVSPLILFFPAALVCFVALAPSRFSATFRSAVIIALFLGEITLWNREFVPYLQSRFHWRESGQSIEGLRSKPSFYQGNDRGTAYPPTDLMKDLIPAVNGLEDLQLTSTMTVLGSPRHEGVYNPWFKDYQATAENPRGNLFPKRFIWLAKQYVHGPLPPKQRLFPVATTVFLEEGLDGRLPEIDIEEVPWTSLSPQTRRVSLPNLDGLDKETPLYTISGVRIPNQHGALFVRYKTENRAVLHTEFRTTRDQRKYYGRNAVLQPTSKAGEVVEIPLPSVQDFDLRLRVESLTAGNETELLDVYVMMDESDENALIEQIRRGFNTTEVQLGDLPGPRVLLFVDAFYPGWTASIDGVPVPILRANEAFKAVEVPAGRHRVRFEFVPKAQRFGGAVSLATFVGCCVCVFLLRTRPTNR